MARSSGCLPLFTFIVFFILRGVESTHRPQCHRVFSLQLTAAATPCRYICAYSDGYGPQYRVRGEDDGTFCRKNGRNGVCWSGMCLTRYGLEDDWSQQADATSKVPLRIRKRDVTNAVKGVSVSKTVGSDGGSSFATKSVKSTKTVTTTKGSGESESEGRNGFKGSYITGFSTDKTSKTTTNGTPSLPNIDIDPFALNNAPSGSQTTETFFSSGREHPDVSKTVKDGGVKVTVHRGPNGERVTTRTVRKFVITRGPTKTVSRVVVRHGSNGESSNLMLGGSKRVTTKTVSVSQGSTGGTTPLMTGGKTDVSTKTSQITTVNTVTGARRPLSTITSTIKQERISGGQNSGGSSTAAKTVSTVAVTKNVRPTLSVRQFTNQGVTPLTGASSGTSNTATLRGVEVEVPGYTAGLGHNWKWVLARRVGMYPPYVQALDPDVLFYKLGLPKPNFPSLPRPIQNILNRVPVHPVGSDLLGYLLSSMILEKVQGFTDGVNGLSRLRGMLSTTNNSYLENSNLLKSLLTGDESSPSGSTFVQKLLLASLSGSGDNALNSPYAGYLGRPNGGVFGGAYVGPYGNPWSTFPGGQFPAISWPFYKGGQPQLGRFGPNPSLYPGSPFGSYDYSGRTNPTSVPYTSLKDGKLVPSSGTPSSENAETLLKDSSYLKALLSPRGTGTDTTDRRYGLSYDESLEPASEKLARVLGEEKLRYLLKSPSERDSPLRRILRTLHRRDSAYAPILLRRLGVRPNTRLYTSIMRQILLRRGHGDVLSPSKYKTPYAFGSDKTADLISTLRDLSGKGNDETTRYLSTLTRTRPQLLETLQSSEDGSEGSSNNIIRLLDKLRRRQSTDEYGPLSQLLYETKHRQQPTGARGAFDSSDTKEAIDALLDYSRRHPSSERAGQISKQITKALLSSGQGPIATEGRRDPHLSKLVSVHGTSRTEARPQGLRESRVISTTYHTTKGAATAPVSLSRATTSALEVTRPITQPSQPSTLLGINSFSSAGRGPSPLQPYTQLFAQPLYSTGGTGVSNQAALLNSQFVSSPGAVYGSPLGQPGTTMMAGTGGYSGYATLPTNAAYFSQYATQPYYVGTSLYGNHPHYVVEGHEAPGTRWQLRVWRHHPGVSSVGPGLTGFGSNNLGSVVSRARETVTRGLQLGSQPGQFGFTSYGPSVPGGSFVGTQPQGEVSGWGGATSQYVVRAQDGSLVVSRQPLTYGSSTQAAPNSGVLVSQTTKETTKTTSGNGLPTMTGGLLGSSFQTSVDGASSEGSVSSTKYEAVKHQYSAAGVRNSESVPELTQSKDSSHSNVMAADSGSESSGSSISSDSSSSSSLQADAELSQSKLRR